VRPLLTPFVAYAAWVGLLRVRLGVFPFTARADRLTFPPLSGLVHEWSRFAEPARSQVWILLAAVALAAGIVRRDRDPLAWLVIAFGGFGAFMGAAVWARWQDFGRPLLPLYAYGLLIVITGVVAMVVRGRSSASPGTARQDEPDAPALT
jgi:hypothetical protein